MKMAGIRTLMMPRCSEAPLFSWVPDVNMLPGYTFRWDKAAVTERFAAPLYEQLINSKPFRRLTNIRFLGAIDYLVQPLGRKLHHRRHTRLEHTLGVASLAIEYATRIKLPEKQEALLVSAALLHDIGHAPLSHSMESVFKEAFGLDHHSMGAAIVSGGPGQRFGAEIPTMLREAGLDPSEVIALISGKLYGSEHNFLFADPINLDTIEAISRTKTYLASQPTSVSPLALLYALLDPVRFSTMLDEFWLLKQNVYHTMINSAAGVLADYTASRYVRDNIRSFSKSDFLLSENSLRNKHPKLFEALALLKSGLRGSLTISDQVGEPVTFKQRTFCVDGTKPPGSVARYVQSSATAVVKLGELKELARRDMQEVLKLSSR